MGNLLPLFIYPENLEFITVEENESEALKEASFTDRGGNIHAIYESSLDGVEEWIIAGPSGFNVYDTKADFLKAFLDLQKCAK